MVVTTIIAILSAVAYPNYLEYTRRAILLEASEMLTSAKMAMDQYYMNYRDFSKATNAGGPCVNREGKSFTVICAVASLDYLFIAKGKAGTRAEGFTYMIDQANTRTMRSTVDGWPADAKCWVFKKGDSC
jgi:type IV pilus assembly protein PilE